MRIFDFPRSKEDQSTSWRACRQLVTPACAVILAALAAWPAVGQELKQASSTLSAKISESGKKRVAVVDFTDLQGNVTELGRFLAEELSGALFDDARGFRVVDRTHLRAILQEHKLAATGLIDPETARQLGKIAGVDTLVTGTITSAFGDTVRVLIKALDVSTAEIIGQSTANIPKTDAIQRLLAQNITSSISDGPKPTQLTDPSRDRDAKPLAIEGHHLLLVLKGCSRSGRTVSCVGSVTNKAEKRRQIGLAGGIYANAVDDAGNQYGTINVTFGRDGQSELEPDLPVNFSLTVEDVAVGASRINIVLRYFGYYGDEAPMLGMGGAKAAFRDVSIQRK